MPEYEVPKVQEERVDMPLLRPYTFTSCRVEDNGAFFTLVFKVGNKVLPVQVDKATARDLHRMLGLRFETDEDHEQQERAW